MTKRQAIRIFVQLLATGVGLIIGGLLASTHASHDGVFVGKIMSNAAAPGADRETIIKAGGAKDTATKISEQPPQKTSERTVFGLSPTGAIVLAAALLVVVILTIVAVARGENPPTYERRP